jgi:hypothetical protein
MATTHPGIDDALEEQLVRAIRTKGWELNQKLTDLLAGKDVRLPSMRIQGLDEPDPREKKEIRLRRYLALIDRAIKRHEAGRLGLCDECGAPLPLSELRDTPWAERCPACSREETIDMFR